MPDTSLLRDEIDEIPETVRRFLAQSGEAAAAAGRRLRALAPSVVVTIARGSSDHAATYFKYAAERSTGRPVASLGPSVVSVYGTKLQLGGQAALAISQSGQSPDIVATLAAARDGGAETIALVNVEGSPLLAAAASPVLLRAGAERSVAATKSVVASVVGTLAILSAWTRDTALAEALHALPDRLEHALGLDWTPAIGSFVEARSLYALGRGPGLAVACEAALKLKETAALHAEAFSGAELLHGPVTLVEPGFPVLAFLPDDAARAGLREICARLSASGAPLFTIGEAGHGTRLPHAPTGHALTEPLSMLVSFYRFVEILARARGLDPDRPRGLTKVTETF
ncbi:aminotransferase [Aureimonas sp. Leaf454]|uniref:SIS domain-containing protein n=1 Tax=Aureimonas sp. Leaf454 TaxID=1736381 RepID=UPI0006FEC4AF|nr:SIS domain-containing protein [Aureimonas sp. Leaf454]KQT42983.1 aminotransferase [Aureimonas sp. Leaf454]